LRAKLFLSFQIFVLVFLVLGPAQAHAQVFDDVRAAYDTASSQWLNRLLPVAQHTFAALAVVELALSALLWGLRRSSVEDICAGFLLKFLILSFCYSLITFFPFWVPAITHGFETAGQIASGSTSVNPTEVLEDGEQISLDLLLTANDFGLFTQFASGVTTTALAFLVWLAFAMIAVQLLLVLIETYVVLSAGILFLGFAGFRATAPLADNYLLYAVRVGIKIFLLYVLVGVGTTLVPHWKTLAVGASSAGGYPASLKPAYEVVAGALTFLFLVWRIPGAAASNLTGNAHFRLSEAIRGPQ
jgi:type IV secretion system protein TrbL